MRASRRAQNSSAPCPVATLAAPLLFVRPALRPFGARPKGFRFLGAFTQATCCCCLPSTVLAFCTEPGAISLTLAPPRHLGIHARDLPPPQIHASEACYGYIPQEIHALSGGVVSDSPATSPHPVACAWIPTQATHFIDSKSQNVADALQALGGARIVLGTPPDAKAMGECIDGETASPWARSENSRPHPHDRAGQWRARG